MSGAPRRSPIDARHRALGARMAGFGGWEMPIQYESVLEEHRACREDAVVFDVSHLGSVRVRGKASFALLQSVLTNDLRRITVGRAQYTHLLDPSDAHVVDDIIVWWVDDGEFLVMPNASNTDELVAALGTHTDGCDIGDVTGERAVLAVQGPSARTVLRAVDPALGEVPRFAVAGARFDGAAGYVAGTGYTGEDGVELHVPTAAAPGCWDALVAAGARPAGLGARDTLRLEMGYPLHGHELGPGITPLQAGLGWVVRFDKGEFRGRAALVAERDRGVARRLRGLLGAGRQVPRGGCAVRRDGAVVGEVTSGNFSPTLERGIALAFLPPDTAVGEPVEIDVRGRSIPAEVVDPPFVERG